MNKKTCLLFALLLGVALWAQGEPPAAEMAAAARDLLPTLAPEQQVSATFPLTDAERFNWHYVPRARAGVPLKDMNDAQRRHAHRLLAAALSPEGYQRATNVMLLDQVLFEQSRNPIRDPELYYFTFFGRPADSGPRGWRLEGHHLSLNFTLQDGVVISTTPSFFGANPALVRDGAHRGLRALAEEEELGRRLLRLLPPEQRRKVVINDQAPRDIVTGASRRAELGASQGLPFSEMTAEQQGSLLELLQVYARRLRPELAEQELARIRAAGFEKIHFAWAGGSEPGQPHYYRLHGPTFVIEYDNTQDNVNHIHTVWRDFERDFGRDLLREHYARSPHHRPASAGQVRR